MAELIGIVFGDGGINNDWQLVISLNSQTDVEFAKYVSELIKELFEIEVAIRKRPNQNTLVVVASSTNLVDFLVTKGAVRGNKISQNINIPKWISKNPNFEKAFTRGMVDTDGCLYTHKHKVQGKSYCNLGFCFSSMAKDLLKSIALILEKNLIYPHITKQGSNIYLYSSKQVQRYLEVFGTSNSRIRNQYLNWRDAGVV